MTDELKNALEEGEAIVYPDLSAALVGYTADANTRAVYDFDKCIEVRMAEGLSYEDAVDALHYNTLGTHVGEKTPIIICLTEHSND